MALIGGTCSAVAHGTLEGDSRERFACVLYDGLRAPGGRRPAQVPTGQPR
jgi:hypothetical protein